MWLPDNRSFCLTFPVTAQPTFDGNGPPDPPVMHDGGMSLGTGLVAVVVVVAGVAFAGAAAPLAHASGADAVVGDLEDEGYIVRIQWINGQTQNLSDCSVVRVNNPDSSNAGPIPGATVYVDVTCPNNLY
jgi:hypothetical protein